MERLLVTGIDFPIGANLALALAHEYQVLGLERRGCCELAGVRTASCDPADVRAVAELAQDWRPRWMIHCGPLAASSWDDPPSAAVAEREPRTVADLARLAGEVGARLAVVSSDTVFSGPRMFHEENSPTTAASTRAGQVRNLERAVENSEVLVIRTHAYGWTGTNHPEGYAQRVFAALAAGAAPACDGRRHASPILATDLAGLIASALEMRLHGLYHLAGAERTTPYHFARELAAACDLPWPASCEQPAEVAAADSAADTSLNSRRARRILERPTPLLRDGLERFARQLRDGWRDRWSSARAQLREVAA